jgi:hypothetical protein
VHSVLLSASEQYGHKRFCYLVQWQWALNQTVTYANQFKQLLVIIGPAFDADNDGLADTRQMIRNQ